MPLTERRREVRLNLEVPLQIRPLLHPLAPVQQARSINMSPRGVFFRTAYPFQVGSVAELSFDNPRELTGLAPAPVRCVARVCT